MRDFLLAALVSSIVRLHEHANLIKLHNIDESAFRFIVMAEIARLDPNAKLQIEWDGRYDLLLKYGDDHAIVEFKFFLTRPMFSLDGGHSRWKGGASPMNEREFRDCIKKVIDCPHADVRFRFIVLGYETASNKPGSNSFVRSYNDLQSFNLERVYTIEHGYEDIACKLIDLSHDAMAD